MILTVKPTAVNSILTYRLNVAVLLARGITSVPQAEIEEHELRLEPDR